MYCTVTEVRELAAGFNPTASPVAATDAVLTKLILRASRYFDLVCGVVPEYFEVAGASVSNLTVYGDGTHFLRLPPYVAGTLDTDITVPDGYTVPTFIEREGYLILSSSGLMLNRITPFPSPFYGGWYSGVPITISAKWGFEATPEDVKMAIVELVINLFRETDPQQVKLVNLEGMALREWMPPRVAAVAKRYRMTGVAFV